MSTSVQPWLSVRKSAKAVEFYKSALDAVEIYRYDGDDGTCVSRLSIDGSDFWVSEEAPEYQKFSPETLGGTSMYIVLIVDDPDAVFKKAVARGGLILCGMKDDHGWRVGRIQDPFGHQWEIAKEIGE